MLTALQLPAQACRPSQQAQRERFVYRRRELAPFRALVRPAGTPQLTPGRRWAPHEAALLWRLGDVALLKGDAAGAQQRWWAASAAGRRRPPAWQGRLLSLLMEAGGTLGRAPSLRALAQLHAEQIRVQWEPMRWFTREHRQALRTAVGLDPLLFLARFMLAANAYIREDLQGADALFIRAAVDMQGRTHGSLSAISWRQEGEEPSALQHRQWQWLAHAWPQEPLFAYAAVEAASAWVASIELNHAGPDALRAQAYLAAVDDAELHLHCAQAARRLRQFDLACVEARRCVELAPDRSDHS